MTTHELYIASKRRHAHFEDESDFFSNVAADLGCDEQAAENLWYAQQRSWYRAEMADIILHDPDIINKINNEEVVWNITTKKFETKVVATA